MGLCEVNILKCFQVNVEVLKHQSEENDAHVSKLELRHLRVIRSKNGRQIKHVVNHDLEEKLSLPFFFLQNNKGEITHVFYPHDDSPDMIGMKKGKIIISMNDFQMTRLA